MVLLDDFRPVAVPGGELQGRQEVVRERVIGVPDLVEHFQLAGGVVAVVADQLAYPGPVLLLDVAAIVLLPRPRLGEGVLARLAVVQQMVVGELAAVV